MHKLPLQGGAGATAWKSDGNIQIGESSRWVVYLGDREYEPQYEAQMARMQGRMLPGCEVHNLRRQARYLSVVGNAIQCEADLREAGYPDAFAGGPNWVMIEYIEEAQHA
jgi:hypothetical protein